MSTAIFDRAHFAHMTGGDKALQEEVLGLFRNQVAAWRADLRPDHPGWRDMAHTLKGSARGIGLMALAEACEAAESADTADIESALASLRTALAQALDAIDAA